MTWALLALAALSAAGPADAASPREGAGEPEPSGQTLLFFNARMALREGTPSETIKLWLLRNGLAAAGRVSAHDEDFRSVVWAAVGALGLCPDGYPKDAAQEGGAGLWPLALHNHVALAAARGPPPETQAPFEAFDIGRQQRFVSLHDRLSRDELRSVTFFRTACLMPLTVAPVELNPLSQDPTDRSYTAQLLRLLLLRSLETLDRSKVQSVAAIEARIFDLELALAHLSARKARREALEQKQRAREVGISEVGAREVEEKASAWPPNSPQAAFLRKSLSWSASEWLTLSRQRRLFLFSQARPLAQDPAALERLELSIVDALVERGEGEEVEAWIGFLTASEPPAARAALFDGERGKRLLGLDRASGFRERAPLALHRGVALLERGERQEALRSFGFAMAHADESRVAAESMALSRRWLSFVLARYQTDAEVIATLRQLVPRQEYNAVVEDLVWRAALRADLSSFERVVASSRRGGAFDAKVERLRPLARGEPGELLTLLRDAFVEEPNLTLRFLRQLLEKIEGEEAQVRAANAAMLRQVLELLDGFGSGPERSKAQLRLAEALEARTQAILEGLGHLELSVEGRARGLSPGHEAFAGAIRLAPADPLPWPFRQPQTEAPSPFVPLTLLPVEWRGPRGELVFGWRVTE